jgi:ornithine cyclodeaminase
VILVRDEDLLERLSAADAVRWIGEAVDSHHRGQLIAPPRAHADLGDGRLVFTTGRLRGHWFGYRSYDTLPSFPGAQIVVVQDERSG